MSAANAPRPQFFNITFPAEYEADVEINRPQKLNALVDPMWPEMKAVFEWLSSNPDVRCVLFSGAGERAFTTGECLRGCSTVEFCHLILGRQDLTFKLLLNTARFKHGRLIRQERPSPCGTTSS